MDLTDRQHSVAVLGGDARQVYAADHLTRAGYAVKTYGLAADTQRAIRCASFEAAINEADIWLLPLPMTRDGFQITGTDISVTNVREAYRFLRSAGYGMLTENELARIEGHRLQSGRGIYDPQRSTNCRGSGGDCHERNEADIVRKLRFGRRIWQDRKAFERTADTRGG